MNKNRVTALVNFTNAVTLFPFTVRIAILSAFSKFLSSLTDPLNMGSRRSTRNGTVSTQNNASGARCTENSLGLSLNLLFGSGIKYSICCICETTCNRTVAKNLSSFLKRNAFYHGCPVDSLNRIILESGKVILSAGITADVNHIAVICRISNLQNRKLRRLDNSLILFS